MYHDRKTVYLTCRSYWQAENRFEWIMALTAAKNTCLRCTAHKRRLYCAWIQSEIEILLEDSAEVMDGIFW